MDKRKSLGILAVAVAAMLLASALVSVDAEAARGGKGKGHQASGTTSGTATMTVTPNQVPLGSASITISGSGFGANQGLVINTAMFPQPWITTNASGSFSILYSPYGTFWAAGPAAVQALNPSTMAALATASYTVCSTNPC